MDYLKIGTMKIFHNANIWNFVYPLVFGVFITQPLYLFIVSTIISIHLLYLVSRDVEFENETPIFVLLSYFGLFALIYMLFFDEKILLKKLKCIKGWYLVKIGRKVPDNWDNEKL